MLSGIGRRTKYKFLNRNPHLSEDHPPVNLDEAIELIEIYIGFYFEEKRKDFEKIVKNNVRLKKSA